jgi:hypothetical protein
MLLKPRTLAAELLAESVLCSALTLVPHDARVPAGAVTSGNTNTILFTHDGLPAGVLRAEHANLGLLNDIGTL